MKIHSRIWSVAIYTLGCKLNQLESEAIADSFKAAGFSLLDSSAAGTAAPAVIIINTCTVTSKADQKVRRAIRKALREHPSSCVIVTGCYARLDADAIAAMEENAGIHGSRLFVTGRGTRRKSALLELPRFLVDADTSGQPESILELTRQWFESRTELPAAADSDGIFDFSPKTFSFHTRAFLKIQDGCDRRCTYCRVRLARGPSVSLDPARALAGLQTLEENGCREAVLTGVNISQYHYSSGTDHSSGLVELLEYLLAGTCSIALRISSLEPDSISEGLAAVFSNGRIRPHFHLSVQSGSPAVLHRMGRGYGAESVERTAALLRTAKDNPFLACDIIAGFPGETEDEFGETLALCRKIGFSWIHAFPYSRRPGTPAFSFCGAISERDAIHRVDALISLARAGRRDYIERSLGREFDVLIESGEAGHGFCRGTSENYLKTLVRHTAIKAPAPGTVLRCVLRRNLYRDGDGDRCCDVEAEEIAGQGFLSPSSG